MMLCLCICAQAFADVLSIPNSVKAIEAEAFKGDRSLDVVVLPQGIERIGKDAFAESGLTRINFPSSLTHISGDPFDGPDQVKISATRQTWAYDWAIANGYLPKETEDMEKRLPQIVFQPENCEAAAGEVISFLAGANNAEEYQWQYSQDNGRHWTSIAGETENILTLTVEEGMENRLYRCAVKNDDGEVYTNTAHVILCEPAEEIPLSDFVFTTLTETTCKVKGYNGDRTAVTVPQYDGEGRQVTELGQAFYGNTEVKEIVLPDSITSIARYAFNECTSLVSIHLPSGLTELKEGIFYGCESLTEVNLPETVRTIGPCAFIGCENLQAISIPEGVTAIGEYAFSGCENLVRVLLPSTLEEIQRCAFGGCYKLSSLIIPESVKTIGQKAFSNAGLTSIHLPEGLTSLSGYAFQDCDQLEEVTIPGVGIAGSPFSGNQRLRTIVFAPGVTSISAIASCPVLEDVYLPSNCTMTNFGSTDFYFNQFFYNCPQLKAIHCPVNSWAWAKLSSLDMGNVRLVSWDGGTVEPAAEDGKPRILSVTFEQETITVGTALAFSVVTRDTDYIQLIVDGEAYDEYWTGEGGRVDNFRTITLAGDRTVSFRPYGHEEWGATSAETVIHVTSDGPLNVPEITEYKNTLYPDDPQKMKWNPVTNADGYTLYLTHPNGTIDHIALEQTDPNYHMPDAEDPTYGYSLQASVFDETGSWNGLLMAYGKGYSQSQAGFTFTVKEEYKPWTGWVQAETLPTYQEADSETTRGYVDYVDPVTVIGETDNGRYHIIMQLTAGGTDERYVDKRFIGTEQFTPETTVGGTFWYQDDGQLIVCVNTNLVGVRAGIDGPDGKEIASSYKHTRKIGYRLVYDFRIATPENTDYYTLWAEDADGNRKTTKLMISQPPKQEETPSPEPDPDPDPDPDPAASQVVIVHAPVTDTTDPVLEPVHIPEEAAIQPKELEPVATVCSHIRNGVHDNGIACMTGAVIIVNTDGTTKTTYCKCRECGKEFFASPNMPAPKVGFVQDAIMLYQYFHNGGQSDLATDTLDSITFKQDVEISAPTDFHGAALTVEGKLTVKAALNNVRSISCNELSIESGGSVSVTVGTGQNAAVDTNGGKLTVAGNTSLTLSETNKDSSNIQCGQAEINGTVTAKKLTAKAHVTIGTSGLAKIREISATKDFTFKSEKDHSSSALMSSNGIISCKDLKIEGTRFQFNGKANVSGYVSMANQNSNFIADLELTTPVLSRDYGWQGLKTTNNLEKNNVKVTNTITYTRFDRAARDYIQDRIIKEIKDAFKEYIVPNNSFMDLANGIRSYIDQFVEEGKVSKERVESFLMGDGVSKSGKSKEDIAREWTDDNQVTIQPSANNQRTKEVKLAVKVGLLEEMFFVKSSHSMKGMAFQIDLKKVVSHGERRFTCNGKTWYIDVNESSLYMAITVNGGSLGTGSATVQWLNGTIREDGDDKEYSFNIIPGNLNKAYNAIMAAGFAEITKELEQAASSAVGVLKDCLADCIDLQGIHDRINQAADEKLDSIFDCYMNTYQYDYCVTLQQKAALFNSIMDDMKTEFDLFNEFKDLFDMAVELKTNTMNVGR